MEKILEEFLKILRRLGVGVACLLLTGCDMAGTHFADVPATRISVDGSVFDVRVKGRLAEALRVNPQYAPRFGPIRARAAFAMAQVSGCKVREVRGDQALATGILQCKGQPAPRVLPPIPPSYSCIDVSQWLRSGSERGYVDYDFSPY